MRNVILIFVEMLICYMALIFLYRKYKTDGIYVYGIVFTFISCIMSLKKIDIMNVDIPIGFASTTSIIVGGNLITQKRGLDELKPYIVLILLTLLISSCFLNLSGLIEVSKYNEIANKSFDNIFEYNLRVYIALIVSLIGSCYISSKIYYSLKKLQNQVLFCNVFSIIIVELFENLIFVLIAYLFEYKIVNLILCIVIRYMIKTIIGITGTIPIAILKKVN